MDNPVDRQPELADKAERASLRHGTAVEALHRVRDAHLRAIEVHERAALLFEERGDAKRAEVEREAVQREWQRLQEAEQLIAEAEARPLPPAGPGPAADA